MSSRLGSPGRGVGDRGRLSERASAERAGHTGARLSRSFRARDSHRVVQQDPDSCLAAGLRRCTRLSGIPFCRGSGMPRSGARALRTARNRRIHPRRPLSAASSTHEAGLCRARRCAAEIFEGTRQGRCEGRCDRRIGRGPETAGRNLRRRDREEAASFGLAPTPLSLWHASAASARSGLLLGVATSPHKRIEASCDRLLQIIDRHT